MKKSKILKNQEPISKSIWRFKQSTDGDDCPNKVRWEDVTLGGLVAREPASSLAKSSSRSSVLSDPLLLPRFLLTLSLSLLVSIGVSDKPGFFSWTQQATRLEREANEHRRYITRRPQIPSGPLNEPNHESSGTTTDLWPTTQIRWREREREREREDDAVSSLLLVSAFEHPERPRATVSKGPWKRHRRTNWYLWVTLTRQALLYHRRSVLASNLTFTSVSMCRLSEDLWLFGSCNGSVEFVGECFEIW